ncbi:MAG: carboxypeptidase regulatory-like domain-containing protein, partial [Candidatus Eremiobacteraeota bacterium]|nr:carboxypeptidase regulatory-like domain-containing protein [Candidatus Eremiobacteraeota bacterium]
ATIVVDQVLTATSKSDGSYSIANVPLGPFSAQTSQAGYQPHSDSGTVAAGDHYLLNISLYK